MVVARAQTGVSVVAASQERQTASRRWPAAIPAPPFCSSPAPFAEISARVMAHIPKRNYSSRPAVRNTRRAITKGFEHGFVPLEVASFRLS